MARTRTDQRPDGELGSVPVGDRNSPSVTGSRVRQASRARLTSARRPSTGAWAGGAGRPTGDSAGIAARTSGHCRQRRTESVKETFDRMSASQLTSLAGTRRRSVNPGRIPHCNSHTVVNAGSIYSSAADIYRQARARRWSPGTNHPCFHPASASVPERDQRAARILAIPQAAPACGRRALFGQGGRRGSRAAPRWPVEPVPGGSAARR
jgi:hypothetical protein